LADKPKGDLKFTLSADRQDFRFTRYDLNQNDKNSPERAKPYTTINQPNMGQSLVQNYLHIVFSTKNHAPLITEDVEASLHAYLGGICNNLDCPPLKIGGCIDHVHILCALSKKLPLIKLLEPFFASLPVKQKSPSICSGF
jgi:hypothetical protein